METTEIIFINRNDTDINIEINRGTDVHLIAQILYELSTHLGEYSSSGYQGYSVRTLIDNISKKLKDALNWFVNRGIINIL